MREIMSGMSIRTVMRWAKLHRLAQYMLKQKLSGKNIQRKSCVRGPTFQERWQRVACATQLSKKRFQTFVGDPPAEKRLPSHVASFRIQEGGVGSRSSRRLQLARHAHNKCIASGQHKRSMDQSSFVCGSAERYSNCNRCYCDYSAP